MKEKFAPVDDMSKIKIEDQFLALKLDVNEEPKQIFDKIGTSGTAGLPFSCTLERPWEVVITRSDVKSETIFGFRSPNYTGRVT